GCWGYRMSRTAWREPGLRPAPHHRARCGTRSSRPPAPDIRRVRRRPPRLMPGPPGSPASMPAPLRSAAGAMPASFVFPKFRMTGIAGVVDRGVGDGDRCLVTGLDRWNELRGSGLHCRDQLVDVLIGGEDLRLDLALGDIGTGREQALVEGAREGGDGFRCSNRVRAIGGGALHDPAECRDK